MTIPQTILKVINVINKIGYEKGAYNFLGFQVFRYDTNGETDYLTIEVYRNFGRDNYGWEYYKANISSEFLAVLDFELDLKIFEKKGIEFFHFLIDNGVRLTSGSFDKNLDPAPPEAEAE